MGDIVESMLRRTMTAFLTNDRKLVAEIEQMDDWVDKLHEAVKRYVTRSPGRAWTSQRPAGDGDHRLLHQSRAYRRHHRQNLMELASKKIKHRLKFSAEGAAELEAFHRGVMDNLKLALGVFMSGDSRIARQLLREKVQIREAERRASESHLARLREGRPESLETAAASRRVRDLKRIHSHICSVAYPVLEAIGELQPSRLTASRRSAGPRRGARLDPGHTASA